MRENRLCSITADCQGSCRDYKGQYRVQAEQICSILLRFANFVAVARPVSGLSLHTLFPAYHSLGPLSACLPLPSFRTCRTDRKSTRLNSSHANISYAVFC